MRTDDKITAATLRTFYCICPDFGAQVKVDFFWWDFGKIKFNCTGCGVTHQLDPTCLDIEDSMKPKKTKQKIRKQGPWTRRR